MDAEEIDLLTGSLREVFAGAAADVPRQLRELGWDDVAAADPAAATTLLFTEKGRALSTAALLDDVVLPAAQRRPAGRPGRRRLLLPVSRLRHPAVIDAAGHDRDPAPAAGTGRAPA